LFEALFLWITFFLAKRSSIDITLDNKGAASALLVVLLNLLIAFLVVLAWYLLRKRFAALDLILFNDDL
jgi:glucan phosphoethanolaminetransferase (alkaline phosphatase superfamily)